MDTDSTGTLARLLLALVLGLVAPVLRAETLIAIDNANPRLFVREANFQLASGGARSRDERPEATTLQIRLDVFAYALPEE